MNSRIVKNDFTKLNKFVKGLSDNHVVKVGILAEKTRRPDNDAVTNADLGAVHEFGSPSRHIPARSWLRMPLRVKSDYILQQAGKGAKKMLAEGRMEDVLERLGLACEAAIDWAFGTAGFGTWAKDKPATIRAKNARLKLTGLKRLAAEASNKTSPLIDHGFLRRAVASKVVTKGAA